MGIHDLTAWQHNHAFDSGNRRGERRTWIVVAITAICMVAEIVAGMITGSMALLADGWHMATHVVALSIAGGAYFLARRWSRDQRFAFGTWKIEILGAYSSALLLGVVSIVMVVESVQRLVQPEPIQFGAALVVAFIGLVINFGSALVLGAGHDHDHGHGNVREHGHGHEDHHDHAHEHGHAHHEHAHHDHDEHGHDHEHHAHAQAAPAKSSGHRDLNLHSAYIHVLADGVTSVLAILALAAGYWGGWSWLDPMMGLIGGGVIAWWAQSLIAASSRVLLDREMDSPLVHRIRGAIESDGDAEIADLHVWRVGRASYAAVMSIVASVPLSPQQYRQRLREIETLAHVSVEVNRCLHQDCP